MTMLSTHPPPAYDEENEWSRNFEIADVKDESTSDDPNEIPLPIRDIDVSQVYGLQIVKDGLNALGVQTDDAFARRLGFALRINMPDNDLFSACNLPYADTLWVPSGRRHILHRSGGVAPLIMWIPGVIVTNRLRDADGKTVQIPSVTLAHPISSDAHFYREMCERLPGDLKVPDMRWLTRVQIGRYMPGIPDASSPNGISPQAFTNIFDARVRFDTDHSNMRKLQSHEVRRGSVVLAEVHVVKYPTEGSTKSTLAFRLEALNLLRDLPVEERKPPMYPTKMRF